MHLLENNRCQDFSANSLHFISMCFKIFVEHCSNVIVLSLHPDLRRPCQTLTDCSNSILCQLGVFFCVKPFYFYFAQPLIIVFSCSGNQSHCVFGILFSCHASINPCGMNSLLSLTLASCNSELCFYNVMLLFILSSVYLYSLLRF